MPTTGTPIVTPSDARSLRYLSVGSFLPDSLVVTVVNQGNAPAEARRALNALVEEARTRQDLEEAKEWFENARREHYRCYDRYYRSRSHEKAHWWSYMSSTFGAADTLVRVNIETVWNAAFPPKTDRFKVPLAAWVGSDECPEDLCDAVLGHMVFGALHAVLSGELFGGRRKSPAPRILAELEPEFWGSLVCSELWQIAEARGLGLRAIMEGAAIAAEWIYVLKIGETTEQAEKRCWGELNSLPRVYRALFDSIQEATGLEDFEELLDLVLAVADQSLCPLLEGDDWHFWWRHGQPEETVPGIRLVRILELLRARGWSSDEEASSYVRLSKLCSENLGWPPPDVATTKLIPSLHSYNRARPFRGWRFWDKTGALENCLLARALDPEAFLPPINAELVNHLGVGPQLVLSEVTTEGTEEAARRYVHEQMKAAANQWLLFGGELRCPCETDPVLKTLRSHCGRSSSSAGLDDILKCLYIGTPFRTTREATEDDYVDFGGDLGGYQPLVALGSLFDRIDILGVDLEALK